MRQAAVSAIEAESMCESAGGRDEDDDDEDRRGLRDS